MAYKTKSRFESRHFTSVPGAAATQLQKALTSDSAHIVPDRKLKPGEAQKKDALRPIQEALNKLQAATVFLDLVPIPKSEIDGQQYGSQTEAAVTKFKKILDIRGLGQSQVDPICGKSTLAQLDDEMKKLQGGGFPDPPDTEEQFADVVVDILGFGSLAAQGVELGGQALKSELVTGEYKALNRDLTVIQFTGSGDHRNPTSKIVQKVEAAFTGHRRGVICIRGESAGGKNLLEVAAVLQNRRFSLAYLGIADGAFFDGDANPPSLVGTSVPIINLPAVGADTRLNIFQSFGNGTEFSGSLRRKIWKGKMANGEIHGTIPGWRNIDLSKSGNVKGPDATIAHTIAASQGLGTHLEKIKGLLKKLPKS